MNNLKKNTRVTKLFKIPTCTLRNFKQFVLTKSQRLEGYSYRFRVLLYG